MYPNPLRGRRPDGATWSRFLGKFSTKPESVGLDASLLEERTLFSASPLVLDAVDLDVFEDAPDTRLYLPDLFNLDDSGQSVQYQLLDNSDADLFRSLKIDSSDDLVLAYSLDQHGSAALTLLASGADGNTEQLTLNVRLEEVNDTPTMRDLQRFTTTNSELGFTVIDLFAAFDDKEDADQDLVYRVEGNTNPSLFTSTTFDLDRGLLVLQHAAGQSGTAELTVVATDTGGLSVGMETPPEFKVYSHWPSQLARDAGLAELKLLTSWAFFDYEGGTYDFSELDVDQLERVLTNYSGDSSVPVVVDIENPFYGNTSEGRDRFAEVFEVFRDTRPDLELGLYRFLPERSYYLPVNNAIAQQHLEMGIESWYTLRADRFQAGYEAWIDRNELYRTEPVADELGGKPVADFVDAIHASLYTFLRNDPAAPYWRPATLDSVTNRISVDEISFDDVEIVRIERSTTGAFELAESTDYYVINFQGNSFQLSRTPGGKPIDFSVDSVGDFFVGAKGPDWENPWHDPNVQYWKVYAEANLAEARKFDKPVYAWISPSISGTDGEFLDQDFFRWQMEVIRPYVDGIVVYEPFRESSATADQSSWWAATTDFIETLERPAATASIVVTSESHDDNRVPIAVGDQLTTSEDTSITFSVASLLANDRDLDGDSLTASAVNLPDRGVLEDLGNGNWKYTPDAGFSGIDSFQYQAFDGQDYSSLATVTLNVSDVNLLPVANNDSLSVAEDQALTIAVATLLRNDTDADGDRLRFVLHEGPSQGTLSQQANGSLVYRPDANFNGVDQFTYWVDDGVSTSAEPATVTLNVQARNDRPVAVADQLTTVENQSLTFSPDDLLANDVDAEGDPVTVQIDQGPKNGKLVLLDDGRYQYTPNEGFAGSDEFTYRLSDGNLVSLTTLVRIDVLAGARALKAMPDAFSVAEDRTLVLEPAQLLANDAGAKSGNVKIDLVDAPVHGSLRWTLNGTIVYVPEKNYFGLDRFNYRISLGGDESEVVTVQIHVKSRNDAPVARADQFRMTQGTTLRATQESLLDNDTDPEDDAIRVVRLQGPKHGSLSLKRDGTFLYRPRPGFSGIDSFRYRLIDEHGAETVARAIIRVARADPAPTGRPLLLEAVPKFVHRETSPDNTFGTRPPDSTRVNGEPNSNDSLAYQVARTNRYTDLLMRLGLLRR